MKIKAILATVSIVSAAIGGTVFGSSAEETVPIKLQIAKFEDDNRLIWPENFESWVFLGTTMGMTYFDETPNPEDPGLMSSVYMAPEAYEHFEKYGEFADGTVFVKSVKETLTEGGGFFMGDELGIEVHVKDRERFPDYGYNFYFFPAGQKTAAAMPEDNICVSCHEEQAAFDNVFTQFYPPIRKKLEQKHSDSE